MPYRFCNLAAAFAILASACFGQGTLSASSFSFTGRQQVSPPPSQYALVTGSGTLSYNPSAGCTGPNQLCGGGGFSPLVAVNFCAGTMVSSTSAAGQTVLNVASTNGFSTGTTLVVNYNGANAEYATVSSVGSGTLTLAGNLANNHSATETVFSDPCAAVTTAPAAAWFWLAAPGGQYLSVGPGTYSGSITLQNSAGWSAGGGVVSISLRVLANNKAQTVFRYPGGSGFPVNTINSNAAIWDTDTATITPTSNPNTSSTFTPPAAGGAYTDGNFGTTIRALAGAPSVISSDAQVTAVNADGSLVQGGPGTGTLNAYQPNGVEAYTNLPVDLDNPTWDPVSPTTYYFSQFAGLNVYKETLNNGTHNSSGVPWDCSTACTKSTLYTFTGLPAGVTCGNRDTQINKQGWWAFDCHLVLTISSITPGTTTVATISGTIPASLTVGSVVYINGNSSCPPLTGLATVTATGTGTLTFNINTSTGCGSYNGNATFSANQQICAINVFSPTAQICTAVQSAWTTPVTAENITNLNTADNKFYILESFNGDHGGWILSFSPGDSQIAFRAPLPMWPWKGQNANPPSFTGPYCGPADAAYADLCFNGPGAHMTLVEISGVQFIAYITEITNSIADLELMRIDTLSQMTVDHEAGGGDYHSYVAYAACCMDNHISGALNAPVVLVTYDTPQGGSANYVLNSVQISNVTLSSGVPTFTTAQSLPSGFVNGAAVQITNVGGITGVNNTGGNGLFCTLSNVGSQTFSCSNISTAAGTYTSGTGVATLAVLPAPFNRALEADVIALDNLLLTGSTTITRLAITRSFSPANSYISNYYTQAHGSLSMDGKFAAWETDFGLPDLNQILGANTGYQPPGGAGISTSITIGTKR